MLKQNWFGMKTQFLKYMHPSRIEQLEFRDDKLYNGLRPKTKALVEIAYQDILFSKMKKDKAAQPERKSIAHLNDAGKIEAKKKASMVAISELKAALL